MARLLRDWFRQPFPLRYACGIGLSPIGRRLFLKALAMYMAGAFFLDTGHGHAQGVISSCNHSIKHLFVLARAISNWVFILVDVV